MNLILNCILIGIIWHNVYYNNCINTHNKHIIEKEIDI